MKFHDELNQKLFNDTELKREVYDKLLEISEAFIEYLDINEEAIKDIVITGSSASYNYTEYSDLDLHLIVDYEKVHEECPIVEGYLWSMKSAFNKDHDISIYGVPVEVYAEDSNQSAISNGIYSLLKDEWIKFPEKIEPTDNDSAVLAKYKELKEASDRIEDSEVAEELLDKIYAMRKAGLEEVGEFSTENLTFKMLRNDGVIERLKQMKKEKIDKQLTLESVKQGHICIHIKWNKQNYGFVQVRNNELYGDYNSNDCTQFKSLEEAKPIINRLVKAGFTVTLLGTGDFSYLNDHRKYTFESYNKKDIKMENKQNARALLKKMNETFDYKEMNKKVDEYRKQNNLSPTFEIDTFDKDSEEWKKLREVGIKVSENSPIKLRVENTYFDYGQKWMWTTLIAIEEKADNTSTWQAINPSQQAAILAGYGDEVAQDLIDKYNKEYNKNESIKESLKNEYKQAFDLLIEGENIVGTLDTDFGKKFVKDVESLYELKSSKLKLRKAKELLRDLQGYLVDEQYDAYNAKIDKFMNNSKNESTNVKSLLNKINELKDETVNTVAMKRFTNDSKAFDKLNKEIADDKNPKAGKLYPSEKEYAKAHKKLMNNSRLLRNRNIRKYGESLNEELAKYCVVMIDSKTNEVLQSESFDGFIEARHEFVRLSKSFAWKIQIIDLETDKVIKETDDEGNIIDESLVEKCNKQLKRVNESSYGMPDEIEEQVKTAIDSYIAKNGNSFEIYVDYRDELDKSTIQKIFESTKPLDAFYEIIGEWDWWENADYEYDYILKENLELSEEIKEEYATEISDMLRDYVSYEIPYSHFDTTVGFDVFLNNPEDANTEYSAEMIEYNEDGSVYGVSGEINKLLQLQGHTEEEFVIYINDKQSGNKFFDSLLNEIENCTYNTGNQVVFLVQAPIIEMAQAIQERKTITIPSDAMCGLFEAGNGSGSVLEIKLEKDITGAITDMAKPSYQARDGVFEVFYKDGYRYNVDEVYGMVSSAWNSNVRFN